MQTSCVTSLTKTLRLHVASFLYIYIDHCDVRGKIIVTKLQQKRSKQFKRSTGPCILFCPPKTTSRSSATFIYFFIYFLNLRSKNSGPLALSGSQDDCATLRTLRRVTCQRPPPPIWLPSLLHQTYHQSCRKLPARSRCIGVRFQSWNLESSRTSMNKRN